MGMIREYDSVERALIDPNAASPEQLYYIQDSRQMVGNCAIWWRAESQGYTCDLADAGKYTKAVADQICHSRGSDIAHPVERVDALAQLHVRAAALPRAHE